MPFSPSHNARRGRVRATLVRTLLVIAAVAVFPAHAAPFELLTAADTQRDQQAHPKQDGALAATPQPRSLNPSDPARLSIRVVAPDEASALPAPVRIELAFQAAPGARVLPASFRLLYGALKLDLTERLRGNAQITERGVVVDQAMVPPGLHRLTVQIGDDQGNLAQREMLLRVGKPA